MKKDTQVTFRLPAELKARLQEIAAVEGRSVAQVCEAFLRAGSDNYKKQGTKFLNRFIGRGQQGIPGT
jgi:predicted transcriptional regulator